MEPGHFENLVGFPGLASPHRTPWDLDYLTSPGTTQPARFGGAFDMAGPDLLNGGMKSPISGMSPATSLHSGCPPIFKNSPNRSEFFSGTPAPGNSLTPGALFTNPSILSPLSRAARGDLPPPGNPQGGVPVGFAMTQQPQSVATFPSRRVLLFRGSASSSARTGSNLAGAVSSAANVFQPSDAAFRPRMSSDVSGAAASPRAARMIETSYTRPALPAPRDLLQPPPALQLDSQPLPSPQRSERIAQVKAVRPCAKAVAAVQELPPTRLRRRTARAAALLECQGNTASGSDQEPKPVKIAATAVVAATRRRYDPRRAAPVARSPEVSIVPPRTPEGVPRHDSAGSVDGPAGPRATSKCRCKKSKCLKLYCDCFAAGNFCDGCACHGCANLQEHGAQVQVARDAILTRNPYAFQPKISKGSQPGIAGSAHRLGCNCKKSHCKKKYCECFQAGAPCGQTCKCENCHNQPTTDEPDKSQQQHIALLGVSETIAQKSVSEVRRKQSAASNSPATPSNRAHPQQAKGTATTPTHGTGDTSRSVVRANTAATRPRSVRAAAAAAASAGGPRISSSVPCAVNEAGNPGAHLEASPAGASAAAAAIAAVKQEPHESSDCEAPLDMSEGAAALRSLSDSKPFQSTVKSWAHIKSPSPHLITSADTHDTHGMVLQLQPGTNIETTEQGRIVHTNRGPMMLVPLTSELPQPPPASTAVSDTVTATSATTYDNIKVQWKRTHDGSMVAIPLSSDQAVQQQQEAAEEGSRNGYHSQSTPQKDSSRGSSTFHTSFDGMVDRSRNLAAAAFPPDGRHCDDALLLSPRRSYTQQRNSNICFSPVLLSRGATRNLMDGQALDVQYAGGCDIEDDGLNEQLQGLAGICNESEEQASRQMLDLDPFESTMPGQEYPEAGIDQGMPFGSPTWRSPDRNSDVAYHTSSISKAQMTMATDSPMTRSGHATAAAAAAVVSGRAHPGLRSPQRKRKAGPRSLLLSPRRTAPARACLA